MNDFTRQSKQKNSYYIKYQMVILTMPTGLMLTCETSKCNVENCNFDKPFFNQMVVATICEQTLLYL